jgi:endonuclease-8
MPEGDTIFRAADTLQRALAGRVVTRFESVYAALTRVDHDRPLAGRIIESVTSRGKHLLMTFSGDLVLHTHMRMHGTWHIYRPGERWRMAAKDMRVVVGTDAYEAIGFNIPVAEFLTARELGAHEILSALGPDLASPAFDADEAARRIAARTDTIETVLLNQRVLAGIGNEFKSEVLFVARVNPFVRASDLPPDVVMRIIDTARRLMRMSITPRDKALTLAAGRRTTGMLNPKDKVYVYGRSGQPCRRCGTPIVSEKTGADARPTYWCPSCQQSSTSLGAG